MPLCTGQSKDHFRKTIRETWWHVADFFTLQMASGSNELGSAAALEVSVLFLNSMLSARCFSLNRLVMVTLPQVGIDDKKKLKFP
jgi:hypothetical protein